MFKHLYSRFFSANEGWLHFAAHSHHPWPDQTRDAQLQYWDDSAKWVDRKWEYLFDQVIPRAQSHLANWLGTAQPAQIVFAPNTHEFICRLLSCFVAQNPIKVLTTDSEFHSFERQLRRMEECELVEVRRLGADPVGDLGERLVAAAHSQDYDLAFFSSVFFNSGVGIANLNDTVQHLSERIGTVVVDGYHSIGAVPVNLASVRNRTFFLGGGYKYLQSGEGVCFLHVPESTELIPTNTGWYAGFSGLESGSHSGVEFADNAQRFAGATFDPSGIYRFNAVMDLLEQHSLTADAIHRYVRELQADFMEKIDSLRHPLLNRQTLVDAENCVRGHFLAFELDSEQAAKELARFLLSQKVMVDTRAARIRFGFGLYQDKQDTDSLIKRLP